MSADGARQALMVRVAGDVGVAVPNQIRLLTTYVLLEQETWFEDELGFLRRSLRPGLRMLDIGANYGMYSLPLARLAGPQGRVWSVEPARETGDFLRGSAGLNQLGQMQVIRYALSNRSGTARLKLESNSELNALVQGNEGGEGTFEEVPLSTLDALAAAHGIGGVDFLKLDAEGEEARIVEGGAEFLASESPLLMFEVKHGERFNLDLVEQLDAAGYRSYRLLPGLDLLAPFDPAQEIDPYQLNLFACKPDRAARLEREGRLAQTAAQAGNADDAHAHYRAAHDTTRAPAERVASLQAADTALSELAAREPDAWRLGSAARVAWESGARRRALALLAEAERRCTASDPGPPREAFLAPGPAFDAISGAGTPAAWLHAALLDQYVTLAAFSTYFAGQDILDVLEQLRTGEFQRPAMERRRQLMRIAKGLQPGPMPGTGLTRPGPDNLNPEIWGIRP